MGTGECHVEASLYNCDDKCHQRDAPHREGDSHLVMSQERQKGSHDKTGKKPPRKLRRPTWLHKRSAQRRNREPIEHWHTGLAQEQAGMEKDFEGPRQKKT